MLAAVAGTRPASQGALVADMDDHRAVAGHSDGDRHFAARLTRHGVLDRVGDKLRGRQHCILRIRREDDTGDGTDPAPGLAYLCGLAGKNLLEYATVQPRTSGGRHAAARVSERGPQVHGGVWFAEPGDGDRGACRCEQFGIPGAHQGPRRMGRLAVRAPGWLPDSRSRHGLTDGPQLLWWRREGSVRACRHGASFLPGRRS